MLWQWPWHWWLGGYCVGSGYGVARAWGPCCNYTTEISWPNISMNLDSTYGLLHFLIFLSFLLILVVCELQCGFLMVCEFQCSCLMAWELQCGCLMMCWLQCSCLVVCWCPCPMVHFLHSDLTFARKEARCARPRSCFRMLFWLQTFSRRAVSVRYTLSAIGHFF